MPNKKEIESIIKLIRLIDFNSDENKILNLIKIYPESFDLQAENKVIESLQNNYFETKVEISQDLSGFEIKEFKADLINEVILTD